MNFKHAPLSKAQPAVLYLPKFWQMPSRRNDAIGTMQYKNFWKNAIVVDCFDYSVDELV